MGNPANEIMSNMPQSSSHSKATFSGATACIGVITLILSIVSVAVPNWGIYGPKGQQSISNGNYIFIKYLLVVYSQRARNVLKNLGKKNS